MPLITKGGLAHAIAYLALVVFIIDTRRSFSTPSDPAAEQPGRRALGADAESIDVLRGEVAKWAQLQEEGAATTARLSADVEELRRDADLRDEQHRRTQGAEPEPEPEPAIGENVKLVKREVVYCQPGDTTSDGPLGNFDYSRAPTAPSPRATRTRAPATPAAESTGARRQVTATAKAAAATWRAAARRSRPRAATS